MKKVLLIGGYGGFGYSVAKIFLENNYEVYINDLLEDFYAVQIRIAKKLPITVVGNWMAQMMDYDCVVLLAEYSDPFSSPVNYIHSNVTIPTNIASSIASMNGRLIVVGWSERFNSKTAHGLSLNDRTRYPMTLSRGNAVISTIKLPRIISPYIYQGTYGNVVKRIYSAVEKEDFPTFYHYELESKNVSWISERDAAIEVFDHAIRRTRKESKVQGYEFSPIELAKYMCIKCGMVGGEIRTERKTYNIYNKVTIPYTVIVTMIEECIDVWQSRGNSSPE